MGAFGITRIANLTGLDRTGIPVVMVCRPNARSSAVFHGKGVDMASANASGVMEAIETWHAEHMALPLRLGSANELSRSLVLADVEALARVPGERFHRDLPLLWVEGFDLIGQRPTWLPLEVVHADCTMPSMPGFGCFSASTNGLASGNHLLEATSHALCEVVERDATSLWHQAPPALRGEGRLDLTTIGDPLCRKLLARLEESELDVGVWETTTDLGIPCFDCLIVDRGGEIGHVGKGAGCHPTREVALLRALTEAVQVRLGYIVGTREDITPISYHPQHLENAIYRARVLLGAVATQRSFEAIPSRDFDLFEDEIDWLLSRLSAAGARQAIAVDLTHPEFGLAVARVVVPGLEGPDSLALYMPGPRAERSRGRRQ
jgi:ribosomal protein S12 methylthiotransferase accessory factor